MNLIVFLLALSILIIVHELGHFLAAKKNKVKVEEFGLGYPPRIWGYKIGETLYSINLLPVGGFVRLLGEVAGAEKLSRKLRKRALSTQSLKVRTVVSVGGVVMNFVLGILIFALVYGFLGIPRKTGQVKIIDLSDGSPAQAAGLLKGDLILGFIKDGSLVKIEESSRLIEQINSHLGEEVVVVVIRNGEELQFSIVPRKEPPPGEGPLGVVISDTEIYKPALWLRPILGIQKGLEEAYFWGKTILSGVGQTFISFFHGKVPEGVAGPVGIYQATSTIQKESGFWAVLHFFGVLSVNLAVVNILPFPALDGSRLFFIAIEAVTRKKPNPKFEALVYQIGMAILIALLLLVTIGDVRRLRSGGL